MGARQGQWFVAGLMRGGSAERPYRVLVRVD